MTNYNQALKEYVDNKVQDQPYFSASKVGADLLLPMLVECLKALDDASDEWHALNCDDTCYCDNEWNSTVTNIKTKIGVE